MRARPDRPALRIARRQGRGRRHFSARDTTSSPVGDSTSNDASTASKERSSLARSAITPRPGRVASTGHERRAVGPGLDGESFREITLQGPQTCACACTSAARPSRSTSSAAASKRFPTRAKRGRLGLSDSGCEALHPGLSPAPAGLVEGEGHGHHLNDDSDPGNTQVALARPAPSVFRAPW